MNTTLSRHTRLRATARALATLCATSCAALAAASAVHAQQFVVKPGLELLAGDPAQIEVTGLPPNTEVTLRARRSIGESDGAVRAYTAQARFAVGADGRLDLTTAVPLDGSSYSGADLRGLFWSMTPQSDAPSADAPPESNVRLEALRADGTALAATTVRLLLSLPAVQTRPAAPFPGAVFASLPGDARRPGLILLGGSEGGAGITRFAPVYASRGFAVLALPYYSPAGWSPQGPLPPELPTLPAAFADIPVERLQQAHDWLTQQPGVEASRIGVIGTSKGAEFALLAATRMPWIKSVVAVVPSDVVWEGWGPGTEPGKRSSFAWRGEPLAFVPYKDFDKEFAGFATGAEVRIRRPQDAGRAAHPERVAPARIPVEAITAPVMVIGGGDDQVWDSGGMAENIATARRAAGRETVVLVYPQAGHALGTTGWAPTTQYNAGPMKIGGTPEANARAQADAFSKTFAFLLRTLGPVPAP
jgi:dienelactone hydrolase